MAPPRISHAEAQSRRQPCAKPSAPPRRRMSGFNNRAPAGRAGQSGKAGREQIEKIRLAQRREGFERYEDPGRLTEFEAGAGGFAPEADRFDKDFSVVEKVHRDNQRAHHSAIIDARRQERLDREEERWQITEEARRLEHERSIALQKTDKAKANRSSLPYDPLTLMYNDGHDGQRLKYYDDKTKVNAACTFRPVTCFMWMRKSFANQSRLIFDSVFVVSGSDAGAEHAAARHVHTLQPNHRFAAAEGGRSRATGSTIISTLTTRSNTSGSCKASELVRPCIAILRWSCTIAIPHKSLNLVLESTRTELNLVSGYSRWDGGVRSATFDFIRRPTPYRLLRLP